VHRSNCSKYPQQNSQTEGRFDCTNTNSQRITFSSMSGGTDAVPGEPSNRLLHKRAVLSLTPRTLDAMASTVKVLLITVFQSIIEVVILCAAGYILARAGILDKPTQRKLNVVNGES
jgi:hypothetical protein